MTGQETVEGIQEELTRRAVELWGEERAAQLAGPLQDAARQVAEIRGSNPGAEVEPGFYQ